MQCPQCQHENREDANFCDACGSPLLPLVLIKPIRLVLISASV